MGKNDNKWKGKGRVAPSTSIAMAAGLSTRGPTTADNDNDNSSDISDDYIDDADDDARANTTELVTGFHAVRESNEKVNAATTPLLTAVQVGFRPLAKQHQKVGGVNVGSNCRPQA